MTTDEAMAKLRVHIQEQEDKCQREHGCSTIEYMGRVIDEHFRAHGLEWIDEDKGWQTIKAKQ